MMTLALALALNGPASSPPLPTWRLVDRTDLHVGLRPAALVTSEGPEIAVGASVQITMFVLQ